MSEQKEEGRPQITKEEMERRKAEITAFHKDQIDFLTTQVTYEELLTKVEELRLRRMVAVMRQAEVMGPPPEEETDKDAPASASKEPAMTATRTLKKEQDANK
jgi:hypothetical protein